MASADSQAGFPPRAPFLAFVADEETEAALRQGLADRFEKMELRRGNIHAAIRALSHMPTPQVLLVDVSGEEQPAAALEELSGVCAPDARVLVVGDRTDMAFYREAVRELGVEEYVAKPLTRDAVARLFLPLLAGTAPTEQRRAAKVVAVAGVRGGVGATTIAVNLAAQLAQSGGGMVALLDLHLRGGAAASLFGARPSAGLRVVLEEPDRADSLFLERTAVHVADRLILLASNEPLDSLPRPRPEGVARLMELLRSKVNLVVVDLRWPPGGVEWPVLDMARHRILVTRPDLLGMRDMAAARKLLASRPGNGTTLTVLNRAGAPGLLSDALVAEALGGPPDIRIPDLPRHVPRAADLGKPALGSCPALARALAPLTQEVGGQRTAEASGLLGRLRRLVAA